MDYTTFKTIVQGLKAENKKIDNLNKEGIDLINFTDGYHTIITHLIGCIYGKSGLETFQWWCYDKHWGTNKSLKMRVNDEVVCQTLEELHAYLEQNKVDDYTIPPQKVFTLDELQTFTNTLTNTTKNYKE
jgi:hypothetical protein